MSNFQAVKGHTRALFVINRKAAKWGGPEMAEKDTSIESRKCSRVTRTMPKRQTEMLAKEIMGGSHFPKSPFQKHTKTVILLDSC